MSTAELQQIEINIKESRKHADTGRALERLLVNRDFKQVILTGYFEQEAIRLVHLKADANMQSNDSQKSIVMQMDAIGSLASYLHTIRHHAAMADKSIAADEQTRDDLLSESV